MIQRMAGDGHFHHPQKRGLFGNARDDDGNNPTWYTKWFKDASEAEFQDETEKVRKKQDLVGGFYPSEKYTRQIGSFPKSRGENKKYLKPPPRVLKTMLKFNTDSTPQNNLKNFSVKQTSQDQKMTPK